jgi:hypothetical protein
MIARFGRLLAATTVATTVAICYLYSYVSWFTYAVFGLRNDVVHHLLIPYFFCLVCGME